MQGYGEHQSDKRIFPKQTFVCSLSVNPLMVGAQDTFTSCCSGRTPLIVSAPKAFSLTDETKRLTTGKLT